MLELKQSEEMLLRNFVASKNEVSFVTASTAATVRAVWRGSSLLSNRWFYIFISAILILGVAIGYHLSKFQKLETYKLLNVAGLLYTLLAVIVLSEIALANPKWKHIAVAWVAPAVLWIHTAVPLGIFIGGLAARILLTAGSGSQVSQFGIRFFFYSILPLSVLNDFVVFPRFVKLRTIESRWRWLGLFLLLTGVALQLIAALMEF